MGFKLLEVQENSEFPELFAAFRAGFTNPGTILWPLFTGDRSSPAFSKDATDIESEAVKAEYIGRFIAWHRADPTSTWLKVVDEDTGRVVGGGRWTFYESDRPYGEPGAGHKVEATWWPEGTERELASECLGQFLESAVVNMNKPHAFLNILFTHPEYRGKGAAALVMKWGLERADKKGLETYIEATDVGKPVYEKFGFTVMKANELCIESKDDSLWKKAESELLPFQWWSMHRPANKIEGNEN